MTSYFDGRMLQLIGWRMLGIIVTVCTLWICYPWAVCTVYRWEIRHTVICGHRLRFTGTAAGLFGLRIKWWLLCLVTAGIYGLWIGISVRRWKTEHTVFVY